eukprot:3654759-Rhodomonas_salina.2
MSGVVLAWTEPARVYGAMAGPRRGREPIQTRAREPRRERGVHCVAVARRGTVSASVLRACYGMSGTGYGMSGADGAYAATPSP